MRAERARFSVGDPVRVRRAPLAAGHIRTPAYLQGRVGRVTELAGAHRDPERLAAHRPGLPLRQLYRVAFEAPALWGAAAPAGDRLLADLYDHWLEPHEEG